MRDSGAQAAACPRRAWSQKQGLAEVAQAAVCSLWWTLRVRVPSWVKLADSSTSAAAVSVRPHPCPLFLLQEPFSPLLCLFICLLGCPCEHFERRHLWSSSSAYVDWTRICLTTIAALSLVAMSCQLLGGRRKWAIVRMMLSCQTKSLGCFPFPLCFSFLVLPSLGDSKIFSKSFASEERGTWVYLEEKSSEKFSANQINVCSCSYRSCCGKGKTMVHAEARWCVFARWYWLSLLKQVSLFQKVLDKWSCCTGVAGHHWLWMVPSVMSHLENWTAVEFSSPN